MIYHIEYNVTANIMMYYVWANGHNVSGNVSKWSLLNKTDILI